VPLWRIASIWTISKGDGSTMVVTALVLINCEHGRVSETAQELLEVPEVVEVYSVAGEYDLVAIVQVKEYDEMAAVVTDRIGQIAGILGTTTLMAFRSYSAHLLERQWGVGLDAERPSGG
jgi:DNA-binding Lrp family transcriptional regulator